MIIKNTLRLSTRWELGCALTLRLIVPALMAAAPGQALLAQQTYSNTNFITINGNPNLPTKATPYPSTIVVSNASLQIVSKVTVTLNGLSDSFPSDLDVLLMGPQGQMAMLMSEVGGQNDYPPGSLSITNVILTLDDAAANFLPINTVLTSGTFKPTEIDHPLRFDFPPPVPPGNSNAVTALSVFQNTDPNGTWSLFVVVNTLPNSGNISNGWTLNLTTTPVPLQIGLTNPSHAAVSWPASLTNCTMQFTHNLSPPVAWQDIDVTPVIVGSQLVITNSISGTNTFYRLRDGN